MYESGGRESLQVLARESGYPTAIMQGLSLGNINVHKPHHTIITGKANDSELTLQNGMQDEGGYGTGPVVTNGLKQTYGGQNNALNCQVVTMRTSMNEVKNGFVKSQPVPEENSDLKPISPMRFGKTSRLMGDLNNGCNQQGTGGDDLTSLSWLHSLDMGGMVPHLATPPTPPASPQPPNLPSPNLIAAHKRKPEPEVPEIDYSIEGSAKPPYSYAALIGMAMKENQNKMTLSAIYKWIKENFAFYKTADPSWQNSIRHNLSLNKCFIKVPRNKDEPGKGGFWRLDPDLADSLIDGALKKRKPPRPTPLGVSRTNRKKRAVQQHQQRQVQHHHLIPQHHQQPQHHHHQQEQPRPDPYAGLKVLVQPVQAAFMPPPTNKPPPCTNVFLHNDGIEMEGAIQGPEAHLKDDLVLSALLGSDVTTDGSWSCRTEELVTDISQTGDPSTYPTTVPVSTHHHPQHHPQQHQQQPFQLLQGQFILPNEEIVHMNGEPIQNPHHQIVTITTTTTNSPSLPSFELSPASLGVEDSDLFNSPEYSEASNDEADSLTSTLEVNNAAGGVVTVAGVGEGCDNGVWEKGSNYTELPSINTFCITAGLTQLTPLEPVSAPVLVQDAHAWGPDVNWDEAKTLSLLDANLDFDNLIDLDDL